jgi:hypothetical protein
VTIIVEGQWVKPPGTYHGNLAYTSDIDDFLTTAPPRSTCDTLAFDDDLVVGNPFTMGSWGLGVNMWKPDLLPEIVGWQFRDGSDVSPRFLHFQQCLWHGLRPEYDAWNADTSGGGSSGGDSYGTWVMSHLRPSVGNVTLHVCPHMFNPGMTGSYQVGTSTDLTLSGKTLAPSSASAAFTSSVTVGPVAQYSGENWQIGPTIDITLSVEMSWPGFGSFYMPMIKALSSGTEYLNAWMTADAEYPEYRYLRPSPVVKWG